MSLNIHVLDARGSGTDRRQIANPAAPAARTESSVVPLFSHVDKIYAPHMRVIVLVRGRNEQGASAFCYLAVRADRLEEFRNAQTSGGFYDPENYGVVVASGEGEPDGEVRDFIAESFGLHAKMA